MPSTGTTTAPADWRALDVLPVFDPKGGPSYASVFRLSRASAYAAVKRGDVPVLWVGNKILVSTTVLRRLLGELPPLEQDAS